MLVLLGVLVGAGLDSVGEKEVEIPEGPDDI